MICESRWFSLDTMHCLLATKFALRPQFWDVFSSRTYSSLSPLSRCPFSWEQILPLSSYLNPPPHPSAIIPPWGHLHTSFLSVESRCLNYPTWILTLFFRPSFAMRRPWGLYTTWISVCITFGLLVVANWGLLTPANFLKYVFCPPLLCCLIFELQKSNAPCRAMLIFFLGLYCWIKQKKKTNTWAKRFRILNINILELII